MNNTNLYFRLTCPGRHPSQRSSHGLRLLENRRDRDWGTSLFNVFFLGVLFSRENEIGEADHIVHVLHSSATELWLCQRKTPALFIHTAEP